MKNEEHTIQERLFSEQNIYLALYSVESYILNKELLSCPDKVELRKLRDKFDEKNIKVWVERIHERLRQVIDGDEHLVAKVYFKPKKYDDKNDKVEFRPLHSASLLDQITSVAMLNVLIYDLRDGDKMSMSNLSRLIPHNFYGNRVAYEPERLFKPWQEQYKKYTSKVNECFVNYHKNGKYKWEISLDLENFFPSINPVCLYNYIVEKIPVNYKRENRENYVR